MPYIYFLKKVLKVSICNIFVASNIIFRRVKDFNDFKKAKIINSKGSGTSKKLETKSNLISRRNIKKICLDQFTKPNKAGLLLKF